MTAHDHPADYLTGIPLIDWFTGYGRYARLIDCLGHDDLWVALFVAAKLVIVLGYLRFARRNFVQYRATPHQSVDAQAYLALTQVFVSYALCGYVWPLLRLVWPAYRLEVLFNLPLAYFTWKLVGDARLSDFTRKIFSGGRMDANLLTQLTGTALAVGVLIYMIHYFMRREERREDFIAKVIQDNTQAIRELKDSILTAGIVSRGGRVVARRGEGE